MADSGQNLNLWGRFRRVVRRRTTGWWLIFGSLLASSAVPCPECGAPLALHIWPLLLLVVMVRALTGSRITAILEREDSDHTAVHQGQTGRQERE
ncbi:MAG: hypothetical protein ACUVSB_14475 [Anaerolineae bacterium]